MSDPVNQLKKSSIAKNVIYNRDIIRSNQRLKLLNDANNLSQYASLDNIKLVDNIWKKIDKEFYSIKGEEKNEVYCNRGTAHKAIRIFVSSTFTDFFNEREILVKQVFPELNEWCALRRLDLVECDLRWGVPIDSTNDDTILTCMSELDRCYNDNGVHPFFIGMIGERYGWIPKLEKLNTSIIEQYNWISDVSITFMEFLHGAIRSKNRNACFFIRKSDSLKQLPEKNKDKFFDSDDLAMCHLNKLKTKLKEYFPEQIFEYSCKYDCIDNSTGREKVKLNEYSGFAKEVLEFFKKAIEKTYPEMMPFNKTESESFEDNYKIEDYYQENFINEKLNFYIDRNESIILKDFINNKTLSDLIKPYERNVNDDTQFSDSHYLLIKGNKGCGKSSLLAHIVDELKKEDANIFYHFFDASIESINFECMAARFILHFTKILKDVVDKNWFNNYMSSYNVQIREDIIKDIINCLSQLDEKFIIIFDGVDIYEKSKLNYFPRSLPENFICIVSADNNSDRCIEELLKCDNWFLFDLPCFSLNTRELFIEKYFKRYNKKLDYNQMKLFLKKENDAIYPLWLNFACYELRVFGDHSTLYKKIEELPDNVNDLISYILIRLNKELGDDLVKKLLCLLEVSNIGIAENEATILIGDLENKQELDKLKWSHMYRQLRPFLRNIYVNRIQFITFIHASIHKVVRDNFLQEDDYKTYNLLLANYYQYHSKNRNVACREACYHLNELNYRDRLIEFIITKECQIYIQNHERTIYINKIRCMFVLSNIDETKNCLYYCFSCATKYDKNFIRMNKDSCYLCGCLISHLDTKNACLCIRHHRQNQVHIECVACKSFFSKNGSLKPTTAKLCHNCAFQNKCCHLEI